jgi:hypothetical protein
MTFITPTIPADANPGPLVHTELATAMLALGWTLEDTVVIGARTHKVYKSAAAGNTYGLDWFLDVSYPTTGVATGLIITPFEGYTAASDVALRGPYSASSTTFDATTYSRFGATTSALETNWANAGTYTSLDSPLSIAGFGLLASITRDRVIVCVSTEATQASYAGFFTPTSEHTAHAGAALFPLITVRLSGRSDRASDSSIGNVSAALTRVPKLSSISNWSTHCVVGVDLARMNGVVGGVASEADNQITSSPFMVGSGASTWSTTSAPISRVGELDGVQCARMDAAVVRGDTVTVSGDSFVTSTVLTGFGLLIEAV